jgi:hypothetical protein
MIHPYTCTPVHPYTHTPVPKLSDILPSPTRCLGSFQTCLPVPAWCLGSYLTPRTSLSPAGAWDHRPGMLLPVARTRKIMSAIFNPSSFVSNIPLRAISRSMYLCNAASHANTFPVSLKKVDVNNISDKIVWSKSLKSYKSTFLVASMHPW